jgi:hypothetical protein
MNCDDAKFYVGLDANDPRAAEMRAHIRACAMCRAAVDHQNNIRATFGLLRYEQPPADLSARCVSQIMRALPAQPVAPPALAWWAAWQEHAGQLFQPLRLAAAAVLIVGLGLYLMHTPVANDTGAPVLWSQIRIEPPAHGAPAAPAITPAPGAVENLPVLLASSNNGPLRMDYGPGGSVPVKFEY